MKITINFEKPYFEEATILALTSHDLDDFYVEANEVDRLNLFFMLEVSLHRFQRENRRKAAARCAFLMAYYLFVPLTPRLPWNWLNSTSTRRWHGRIRRSTVSGKK